MNSVAGFKAVDAEGNELGIMSLADITAAVKESIMQDAAMARSVATLSEASKLAATDTCEDQLPQRTDLTWARGLDSNGNSILISKESLASVVGGLLSISKYIKLTTGLQYVNSGSSIELPDINGLLMIKSVYYFSGYKLYWVSADKYEDLAPTVPGYGMSLELSFVEGVFNIKNVADGQRRIDYAYQTLPVSS